MDCNLHLKLLIEEAQSRKILVSEIFPGKVFKYQYKDHIEYGYAQLFSSISAVANRCCANKEITKTLLRGSGVEVADGLYLSEADYQKGLDFAIQLNWNIVLKPDTGEKGKYVYTSVKNESDFQSAWEKIFSAKYDMILIEEKFEGLEYRVFATRDEVLAIGYRKPANVVGNGKNTIGELIEAKNSDPRRSNDTSDPVVKIKIDEQVKQKLVGSGLTLDSIPQSEEVIYLRDNSNLSTGGDSIDFTDIAHPSVREIAINAVRAIPGLLYGGVDFMTKDISSPQGVGSYIIIEMNSSPGINMHHYPYEGRPRNVAKGVIDMIFPETINV